MLFLFKRRVCLFLFFNLFLGLGWDAVEGLDSSLSVFELPGCLSDLCILFVSLVDLFLLSDLSFTSVWFDYSGLRSVVLLCGVLHLLSSKDFLILRIDKGLAPSISSIEGLGSLRLPSASACSSSLRPLARHLWGIQRCKRITTSFEIWEIFFISDVYLFALASE